MRKETKSLMLSALLSAAILSGCGKDTKNENIEQQQTNNEQLEEVIVNDSYNQVTKILEPGKHCLELYFKESTNNSIYGYKPVPVEIPDGYEVLGFDNEQYHSGMVLFNRCTIYLVNTKPVEVVGYYSELYGMEIFPKPGVVVEEKNLELHN